MKISEMTQSVTPSNDDVFPVLEGGRSNRKITFGTYADWCVNGHEYSALGSKTISGAIDDSEQTASSLQNAFDSIRAGVMDGGSLEDEASGTIVAISDNVGDTATKAVLTIEPHQEGTGDPSPSNVRPITGYTAVNVTRCGKNQFNQHLTHGLPALTVDASEESITASTRYAYSDRIFSGSDLMISALSANLNTFNWLRVVRYKAGVVDWVSAGTASTFSAANTRYTFLVPGETDSYVRIVIGCVSGYTVGLTESDYVQAETGSTATTYEPYTEQTYPITIPSEAGTVYGGTLDVQTGELRVTHGVYNVPSLTAWNTYSHIFYTDYVANIGFMYNSATAKNLLSKCNRFTNRSDLSNADLNNINGFRQTDRFYFAIQELSTSGGDAAAWLANNPLQICAELATPLTYTLTPTEIELLTGSNTIWMDADGQITIGYEKDVKAYIDSKFAELQALILENNG